MVGDVAGFLFGGGKPDKKEKKPPPIKKDADKAGSEFGVSQATSANALGVFTRRPEGFFSKRKLG